jgi:hypothetical protein
MKVYKHKSGLARAEFDTPENPTMFTLTSFNVDGNKRMLKCIVDKTTRGIIHFVSYDFFGVNIDGQLKLDQFEIIEE